MHDPIYPESGEAVAYSIDAESNQGVTDVKLYERVSIVNWTGAVINGTEVLLGQWTPSGSPSSATCAYTKIGGYSANRLIRYRFVVTDGGGDARSHDVTYAVRPYPVPNQPAPIYVQGDIDSVSDVVFIPDTDITSMDSFRDHCRLMILDAMFADPAVAFWGRQFNFYINPHTGTATDYDKISTDGTHQLPSNWANLSFAEMKVLLHQNSLRDYAMGTLCSTELPNRGTMMHEAGHALFKMADEYPGGAHWQASTLPNNWSTLAGAQADAPSRGKTAADAQQMGTTGWYKICLSTCEMNNAGLTVSPYDDPCAERVNYVVIDTAINP